MIIYLVMNEGNIVYASKNYSAAETFSDSAWNASVKDTASEYGFDIDELDQSNEAAYQAGYDGGIFEVVSINTDAFDENDEQSINLPESGGECIIERCEVMEALSRRK